MNVSRSTACRWILTLVCVGFLITAVEVRYLHLNAVRENWVAWIPTIASVIAVLGAALGLFTKGSGAKLGAGLLALVALAGLAGVYFHTELKPERFAKLFSSKAEEKDKDKDRDKAENRDGDKDKEKDKGDSDAPPLAPLAMLGLGLIGAVAVLGKENSE